MSVLVEQVVCCKLTPLQIDLYNSYIKHYASKFLESEEVGKVNPSSLSAITQLKKLCNRKLLSYTSLSVGLYAQFANYMLHMYIYTRDAETRFVESV